MDDQAELNDGRELHRIDYKVRLREDHPLYWKSACGTLSLWVYAQSPRDAIERCRPFLAALPFELTSDEAQYTVAPPRNEAERIVAEQAEWTGFSQFYEPYDSEADERDIPFPGEKVA